jgi:predicted DNA-binding transcriptional regulator AlpA
LRARLGNVSRTTVWRERRNDPTFPKPIAITRGIQGWLEPDIEQWLERKRAEAASRTMAERRPEAALAARRARR